MKKYEESLKIEEELGDKLGIAQTLGQISKIHFEKREFRQTVKLNLIALVLFKYLKSPQMEIIILELKKTQNILGKQKFNNLVEEVMPEVKTYLKEYGLEDCEVK